MRGTNADMFAEGLSRGWVEWGRARCCLALKLRTEGNEKLFDDGKGGTFVETHKVGREAVEDAFDDFRKGIACRQEQLGTRCIEFTGRCVGNGAFGIGGPKGEVWCPEVVPTLNNKAEDLLKEKFLIVLFVSSCRNEGKGVSGFRGWALVETSLSWEGFRRTVQMNDSLKWIATAFCMVAQGLVNNCGKVGFLEQRWWG